MIRFGPGLKRVNGDQKYVASGTCGVQSKLPLLCGNGIKKCISNRTFPTGLPQRMVHLWYEKQPNQQNTLWLTCI